MSAAPWPRAAERAVKTYRYYDLILGAYVCVVLCANLIGAAKVATVQVSGWGFLTFMAGVLFFPAFVYYGTQKRVPGLLSTA